MATDNDPGEVIVTCCHCGVQFDERLLGGPFLDRRCPRCARKLCEEDYDALAARLLDIARQAAREANDLYPRIKNLEGLASLLNNQIVLVNQQVGEAREKPALSIETIPLDDILPEKSGKVLMLPVRAQVRAAIARETNGGAIAQAFKDALTAARGIPDGAPAELSAELASIAPPMELEDEHAPDIPPFDGDLSDPEPPPAPAQPPGNKRDNEAAAGTGISPPARPIESGGPGEKRPRGGEPATGRRDKAPLSSTIASQIDLDTLEALTEMSRQAETGAAADAQSDRDFKKSTRKRKRKHDRSMASMQARRENDELQRKEQRDEQKRLAHQQFEREKAAKQAQDKLHNRLVAQREQDRLRAQLEYDREHPREAELRNALESERERNRNREDRLKSKWQYAERELKRQREKCNEIERAAAFEREEQRRELDYALSMAKHQAEHEVRSLKRRCNLEVSLAKQQARVDRNAIRRQAEADKEAIRAKAVSRLEEAEDAYFDALAGIEKRFDDAISALSTELQAARDELDTERGARLLAERRSELGEVDALLRRRALLKGEVEAVRGEIGDMQVRIEDLSSRERDIHAKIEALALDRYYISKWFRMTRAPLDDRDTYGNEYSFVPYYHAESGRFALSTNDQSPTSVLRGWGQYGEFTVFEWLRRAAANPSSPLSGAKILPDLVFSWQDGADSPIRWAQVDCLVLTRRLAAFVEVKHWSCEIEARAPFTSVRVQDSLDAECSHGLIEKATFPLAQARRASAALSAITDRYPADRILDVTVFVDPVRFNTDSDRFAGTAFAGWCSAFDQNFVDALEAKESSLRPLVGKGDLDALADEIFDRVNDVGNRRSLARRQLAAGQLDRFFSEHRHDTRYGWVERGEA